MVVDLASLLMESDLLINLTKPQMTDGYIKQWSGKICSKFKLAVNKLMFKFM